MYGPPYFFQNFWGPFEPILLSSLVKASFLLYCRPFEEKMMSQLGDRHWTIGHLTHRWIKIQ